jgi:hypothetical protein
MPNELVGTVIDIEKEQIERTNRKKPLALRILISPWTFIAAQCRALVHGPFSSEPTELVQRWIIRFQVPKGESGEGTWTLEMLGSEFEGTIRIGDTIKITGKVKKGSVIHRDSVTNISAGAEVTAR